jgi:hypothetical protein
MPTPANWREIVFPFLHEAWMGGPFGQWRLKFNRLEGFIKCRVDSRLHQTTSGVHCARFTFALQRKIPDVAPAINTSRSGELCDADTCEGHGSSPQRVWPVVTCLIPEPQVIIPVDVTSKGSVNKLFSINYRLFIFSLRRTGIIYSCGQMKGNALHWNVVFESVIQGGWTEHRSNLL